jgi:hypothetical protein
MNNDGMTDFELMEILIEQDPKHIDRWMREAQEEGVDLLTVFSREVKRLLGTW